MQSIPDRKIRADVTALSMCTLLKEDGTQCSMRSLWEVKPAIFIFLRHFGCDACRLHAMEVWEKRATYQSKGAEIHFIGNGSPHFLKIFKEQFGLQQASFFTDPSLKAFKAAGFRKGFWIDPGEMHTRAEFLRLAIPYHLKRNGAGNVWQLGGVLAVMPGGKVTYQFTSQAMGDYPPSGDIPPATE